MSRGITAATISRDIMKGKFNPHTMLSNMAIAYFQQAQGAAKEIMPVVPVDLSSDNYFIFSKEDLLRNNVRRKPQFGKVTPAIMAEQMETYRCEVDQIIVGIDQIARTNQIRRPGPAIKDPRVARVKFMAEQMNIHQDLLFAKKFFKKGVWNNEWTGGTAYSKENKTFIKFTDANSTPIKYFDDIATEIQQKTGRRPNKLGLGVNTFNALKEHPEILERVKFGGTSANPAAVTREVLAQLFQVKKVVVFSSIYNTADYGEEEDMQFICDADSAIFAYATDTPSIEEPSAGYIFSWDMLGDGNYIPTLQYEGEGGTHSEFLESLYASDMKVTAPDLAAFLSECV